MGTLFIVFGRSSLLSLGLFPPLSPFSSFSLYAKRFLLHGVSSSFNPFLNIPNLAHLHYFVAETVFSP